MNAVRGVIGLKIPTLVGQDNVIKNILEEAKSMDLCRAGDKVAVIHGIKEGSPDQSNIMKILTAWNLSSLDIFKFLTKLIISPFIQHLFVVIH